MGVIRARVGYAGGASKNPTYFNLDGHSESVQIDYDPIRISYDELLEAFWHGHDPTVRPWNLQYASIIFYHNQEQKRMCLASKQCHEVKLARPVLTRIGLLSQFYLAEDYHQKYYLRQVPELFTEFRAMYPNSRDLANSTAAMRTNAFVAGYGTMETLQDQLGSLGLSTEANDKLLEIVGKRRTGPHSYASSLGKC